MYAIFDYSEESFNPNPRVPRAIPPTKYFETSSPVSGIGCGVSGTSGVSGVSELKVSKVFLESLVFVVFLVLVPVQVRSGLGSGVSGVIPFRSASVFTESGISLPALGSGSLAGS